MKTLALCMLLVVWGGSSTAAMNFIDSTVGNWPKTWPAELEPLRKQAVSGRGGVLMSPYHEIRFTNRDQFESVWPSILSLKSDGAALTLIDGKRRYRNSKAETARVMICPPMDEVASGLLSKTRITLIVDGRIIDLNRIKLPENTPIVDARFRE